MYHIIAVCITTMLYEVQNTRRAAGRFVGAQSEGRCSLWRCIISGP